MRWYTVIGTCEEQRHAFHVKAASPAKAEAKAKKDHDKETDYTLVVAGVVLGKVMCVDEEVKATGWKNAEMRKTWMGPARRKK